jgi:predicted nucleic acid-binding protein
MIAVDTNLLVYAHREDSPWHQAAADVVATLAEGRASGPFPALATRNPLVRPPEASRKS